MIRFSEFLMAILLVTTASAGTNAVLVLSAADAQLRGDLKYNAGSQIVEYWDQTSDAMTWEVANPVEGIFEVEIQYACDTGNSGSEFVIEFNRQKVKGTVTGTGGWDKPMTFSLGEVTLPKGKIEWRLKARSKPHQFVMNFHSITLRQLDKKPSLLKPR